MPLPPDAWLLWAKTPSARARETPEWEVGARTWLALPQHLRDAADVGERLTLQWLPRRLQDRLVRVCGGDLGRAAQLVGFLCGVHDVGKADWAFQSQLEGSAEHGWLWEQVRSMPSCPSLGGWVPEPRPQHAEQSDLILRRFFAEHFPGAGGAAVRSLTVTAGCHHGRLGDLGRYTVPGGGRAHQLTLWLDRHGPAWGRLWEELAADILERTGARETLSAVLDRGGLGVADQLLLCGLVTTADWIASNQELFPLTESGRHRAGGTRADDALERLALTRAWQPHRTETPPHQRRFGWHPSASLRPCQIAAVEAVGRQDTPCLVIIEEEMGQGKTEAALLAAEVLAGRLGSGGVAFALPTMATADSMFARVKAWVETLETEPGSAHSLFLGHSRSWLEPQNEKLIRRTRGVGAQGEQTVVAHEWFTGKRGMLAEFTVSTIDQVLMSALATRYVTMRHLGLAGKVVILDEVHSYDVYTSSYLQRTLTWCAAHGVPVILLSATLASGLREQLENAYREGVGANPLPTPDSETPAAGMRPRGALAARKGSARRRSEEPAKTTPPPYPRVSVTSGTGTEFAAIAQRSSHRRVNVQHLDDDLEALSVLLGSRLGDGGVAGVVCNTVTRAQDVFESLSRHFGEGELELHHSQFTAGDRAQREQALVAALGPNARRGVGRPLRRIVVGTQVLEQSLDIDLDLLVTDLAPGDSMAQRAGRLHRHDRPASDRPGGLQEPEVFVRGVDLSGDVPVLDTGTSAVYGDRVLLATLAVLQPYMAGKPWCLTHELEAVVEEIYRADPRTPDSWRASYDRASALEAQASEASRNRARTFQLVEPRGSRGDLRTVLGPMIAQDADRQDTLAAAYVRDIDPALEVLVVQEQDGLLSPLPWLLPSGSAREGWFLSETSIPPPRFARAVAMSTVRLPRWLVAPWELDRAIAELETLGIRAWQEDFRLRGQLVVRVDEQLRGSVLGKPFGYDRGVGIHSVDALTERWRHPAEDGSAEWVGDDEEFE